MPDSKITALTALTSADPANDMFPIVDVSDTSMAASGTTKRISINNLLAASGTATLASATITGDLTVDTNVLKVNTTLNKVSVNTTTFATDSVFAVKTPSGKFDVRSYGGASVKLSSDATMGYNAATGGEHIFQINDSNELTLNTSGLGLGSSPSLSGGSRRALTVNAPTGQLSILELGINGSIAGYLFSNATQTTLAAVGATFFSIETNAVERLRIDSSGNVGIGVTPSAGKGCLQLSSGINFPATQVASSDANTLDDYEEGSWVPTLNSGTFSSASCRYTKIGNMVTIFFDVTVGTGGGDRITNLPFAAASTSTVASGIYTNNQTYAAGTTAPVVVVGGSSSTLFFRTVGTGVAFSAMTLTAAANLTGSISYFV